MHCQEQLDWLAKVVQALGSGPGIGPLSNDVTLWVEDTEEGGVQ